MRAPWLARAPLTPDPSVRTCPSSVSVPSSARWKTVTTFPEGLLVSTKTAPDVAASTDAGARPLGMARTAMRSQRTSRRQKVLIPRLPRLIVVLLAQTQTHRPKSSGALHPQALL